MHDLVAVLVQRLLTFLDHNANMLRMSLADIELFNIWNLYLFRQQ